ncbi:MAG: hypothetical protein LBI08_03670, partial [Methanomassiliicoccaceae archaeon]|nr:hypothetical protein [Methanomassiliicoccaceae archaeon]
MEGRLAWQPEPISDEHKRMLLVYEADGTQRKAIRAASDGRTFVMRAPPGTGSTRTICNMISEAMYNKKTVLVVSEKDIALRTLKKRLDEAGIGKFCLHLHSGNADKKKMLDQFRNITDNASRSYVRDYQLKADDAERIYSELSGPMLSLHKRTNSGMTLYEMILHCDKLKNKKYENIEFPDELVDTIDPGSMDRWTVLVSDLVAAGKALGHPSKHPLNNIGICEFGPETKENIIETLNGWTETADETADAASALLDAVKVNADRDAAGLAAALLSLNDIPKDVIAGDRISVTNDKIRELLASMRRSFDLLNNMKKKFDAAAADEHIAAVDELYERMGSAFGVLRDIYLPDVRADVLEHYIADILVAKDRMVLCASLLKDLRKNWKDTAIALNAKELMEEWNDVNTKKLFSGAAKRSFVKDISVHLKDGSASFEDLPDMIGVVEGYVSTTGLLKSSLTSLDVLGGGTYSPIRIDCDALEKIYDTITSRLESLKEFGDPDDICRNFNDNSAEKAAFRYLSLVRELSQKRRSVSSLMGVDISAAAESDDREGWRKLSEKWITNIDRVKETSAWNRCRNELAKEGLMCVADAYMKGMGHDAVLTSFDVSVHRYLRDAYMLRSPLAKFDAKAFGENAEQFGDMMDDLIQYSRAELSVTASSRVYESFETSQEMVTLKAAIATAGRGTTIRNILENIRGIVPIVCPCMMMSPPAVSKYLGHDASFDIVIIDPSQMPTYKAIDLMTRGKDVVIIGDDKQLPPMIGDADTESVMDDCLSVSVPRCDLGWNYRSEGLTEFGNTKMYEMLIGTFPQAMRCAPKINAAHVNGRYDRTSKQNEAEAEAVVKEVMRRLKAEKEKSIGVVAFSEGQRDLISDLLAKEAVAYPKLSAVMSSDDGLFVRYVNDIQGHERNTVILSTGIGKDAAGKLTADLSPFNKANGEKRLNAAIALSRENIVIFASVRPADLAANDTAGVRLLKELLEYTDKGLKKKWKADEVCGQISKAIADRGYAVQ